MTKEELKQIPTMAKRIQLKKEQLAELRELATCVPALNTNERVQSSVVNRSMEQVDKIIDYQQRIQAEQLELFCAKAEAYELISNLAGNERIIMELRYISGKTWEEIAIEMDMSYRHVVRLHGIALRRLFG